MKTFLALIAQHQIKSLDYLSISTIYYNAKKMPITVIDRITASGKHSSSLPDIEKAKRCQTTKTTDLKFCPVKYVQNSKKVPT